MYTRCVSTGTFLRNEKPSVVRLVRCARSRRRCLCKFFNNFSIFCLSFLFVRFLPFDSAELKMDVLRERECKDSIERQLADERKLRGKSSILSLTRRIDMFKLDPADSWHLLSADLLFYYLLPNQLLRNIVFQFAFNRICIVRCCCCCCLAILVNLLI